MANIEPPITLEEQVMQMKKYVSFRQRKKMREFLEYVGYFRASRYGKFLLSRVGVTGAKSKEDALFALYKFDVELRRILNFYCNRTEVRFKSALSNACSIKLNSGTFYGSSAIIRVIQPSHTLVLLLKVLCCISHT